MCGGGCFGSSLAARVVPSREAEGSLEEGPLEADAASGSEFGELGTGWRLELYSLSPTG